MQWYENAKCFTLRIIPSARRQKTNKGNNLANNTGKLRDVYDMTARFVECEGKIDVREKGIRNF